VPFAPDSNGTQTVSATTTSASVTVSAYSSAVMITNAGTGTAFVRFGTGAQTATTADTPILPSMYYVLSKGQNTTVAVVCGTGTATVYVTTGEGLK
jgi:hypothetical protein